MTISNTVKPIDVLILCGGLGKRLRKISKDIPKPMVKFGNLPFLDLLIKYMASFGFRRFILAVGYKAGVISKYYSNKRVANIDIVFSYERRPLGTGGAVKNAKKLVKSDPFFVLNGDSYCQFSPSSFLKFHRRKKSLISILLREAPEAQEYGAVKMGAASRILNFNEKNNKAKRSLINAGIYTFSWEVFKLMPAIGQFSLERDLFPAVISRKRIYGYKTSGLFIDIGTPQRYKKAKEIFSKK